ncbi:UNVERIFIED_CONTAM: putative ABC transport system ATP-binding protein [Brevibacillus sp. OAP136]
MGVMLTIENVMKYKGNAEGAAAELLFSGITASVRQGERIALIGTSGQGKSTLLRVLSQLDLHDGGWIALHQRSSEESDAREWRKQVCYVAQQAVMLPGSIEDNLRTASRLHGQPYDDELVGRLMGCLGLEHLDISKRAADLSGGEKQRVSLIRSMLLGSELLLLDEITASLDKNSARKVEETLDEWHQTRGTASIWVTHDQEQAQRVSDRTWFMANGTLAEDAPTAAFFEQPTTEAARSFLQLPNSTVSL